MQRRQCIAKKTDIVLKTQHIMTGIKKPTAKLILFFLLALLAARPVFAQSNTILNMADSLYTQHNWKIAKENYIAYLKDTSVNSIAWNHLAVCDFNLGLLNDAAKHYQKALSFNPPPQIRNIMEARLARTYAAMKQPDQALSWLDKAATSGYANLPELDTLPDFNPLRANEQFRAIHKKIYGNVFPCSLQPRSQDFNFWIGEWDVYATRTKTLVGHSIVQAISGGCGLLENWTSATNHTGKSVNYYDPAAGKWEQDWVGSAGDLQHYLNGEYKDGAMHFSYKKIVQGQPVSGNFMFYNIDKDTVRQYQDITDDNGKIISVSYDLTYIRKKQ